MCAEHLQGKVSCKKANFYLPWAYVNIMTAVLVLQYTVQYV